ncbi:MULTISPECIES: exopolysaccharide production repressor protein [unclassified Rhizobium]|uniref:exopolysaccharide production repressor protein n=1 Tax=unclassified Rhizobium TaxID=2613769 RepID=UPI0006F3BB90|nr:MULTISPECIES: exopolysaccharide production repressor protein [unclassified Rhizobium]KQV33347.1 exopolysaccharide production repressor exox [Rhizobium sp. Root1212]KRD22481.1 exopolysaccharide production repressor exox [Rhizobium sp. Root268]
MYGPRVFVSMIGALAVFALATYAMNGSLWSTLVQTVLCALLLQVGYFLGVVFLIWRAARGGRRDAIETPSGKAGETEGGAIPVSRFNKPGPTNF